jgi:hypothetical protein
MQVLSKFLGFGFGEAEVSVLLRHDAALLGNRFLTFRDHYVFLTSRTDYPGTRSHNVEERKPQVQ